MTERDELALENHRLLQEVNLQAADADRQVLQQFGLSPARYFALSHIAERGELTASDLCVLMLCDKANVTRLLDGLQQEGLVLRTRDTVDGRRTCVTLTEAGGVRWAAAHEAHRASVRQRLAPLSAEEQTKLNALLLEVKTGLTHYLTGLASDHP